MKRAIHSRHFRFGPICLRNLLPWTVVVFSVLALAACGGGPGSSQGPPPPTGDFTLSVNPSNLALPAGTSIPVSVSASGSSGFSSAINVQASGLPVGVTVSPSPLTVRPEIPAQLTLSAALSAGPSNVTVTLTGTSGSLTHNAQLSLATTAPITSNTPPFRTRYVRTDAATLYMGWMNSSWIIFNPPTNRFFVTDPGGNRVFALDANTQTVVGSIPVPGAFSIDDTPDHLTLFVGTQIGDVYALDPVGMTVTKRYVASQIGPDGFQAYSVRVMADGRLALLGGQGGIPSVDGYGAFAIWSPADNSISIYASQYGAGYIGLTSYNDVCDPVMNMIFAFTRTPDRRKVVLGGGGVCEIDEETGAFNYSTVSPGANRTGHLVISPDGNWIAIPQYPDQALVLDAHTLAQVNQFPIAGETGSAGMFFIGPDSNTLFTAADFSLANQGGVANVLYAYNLTTGQQIGWLPNLWVTPYFGAGAASVQGPGDGPQFQAIDGTGLLAGPMEEGVGFLDTAALRTSAVGSQFTTENGFPNPATGPTNGGTSTTWGTWPATQVSVNDVYFGSQRALSVSTSTGAISTMISAITPPGAPGPADIYALATDGGVQIVPEGFSYGPTILQSTPESSTAEGGGVGIVYGYGFGPQTNASPAPIPPDLHVTVAGRPAAIIEFAPNAYGITYPPFQLEAFTYTIPPGQTGSSGDVTVTTNSGSATVHNGMTYVPAMQTFSLPGAALAQGIYDPHRDLYYFTDVTSVRVFSRAQGSWLAPIYPPNARGLWGIALSPDGTRMAVADAVAEVIYVLSPTNAFPAQRFLVPQLSSGTTTSPVGVAISDAGTVYFSADTQGGTGYDVYFKLITSTGQVTPYDIGTNSPMTDQFLRLALKDDNSRVYGNDDGQVFSINTATDQITYEQINPGCCYGDYDLALSGDQKRLAATGYFYDSDLNAESYMGLTLREQFHVGYLYGMKLSADGRMLFQPTVSGIDVIDGRLGTLISRVALPVILGSYYDTLVSDGTDNVLVTITGANGDGIAVVDLSSIPEPPALPYEPLIRSENRLSTLGSAATTRRGSATPTAASFPRRPAHTYSHELRRMRKF